MTKEDYITLLNIIKNMKYYEWLDFVKTIEHQYQNAALKNVPDDVETLKNNFINN